MSPNHHFNMPRMPLPHALGLSNHKPYLPGLSTSTTTYPFPNTLRITKPVGERRQVSWVGLRHKAQGLAQSQICRTEVYKPWGS
jgi:hypothetical protein